LLPNTLCRHACASQVPSGLACLLHFLQMPFLKHPVGFAECTWSTISFLQKFWELVRVAPVFASFFVCTSYLCRHNNA
jgi:hypothetical protein